jgi:ABC-type nickel/cobalt efflux system permease component RcnA
VGDQYEPDHEFFEDVRGDLESHAVELREALEDPPVSRWVLRTYLTAAALIILSAIAFILLNDSVGINGLTEVLPLIGALIAVSVGVWALVRIREQANRSTRSMWATAMHMAQLLGMADLSRAERKHYVGLLLRAEDAFASYGHGSAAETVHQAILPWINDE